MLRLAVNEDRHEFLSKPFPLGPFARPKPSFLLCHEFIPLARVLPRAVWGQPFRRGLAKL